MKVRELILLLQQEDPERLVIMSSDSEGNHFSPLSDIGRSRYWPEEHESGIDELTPELVAQGYSEEDLKTAPTVVRSITLWP